MVFLKIIFVYSSLSVCPFLLFKFSLAVIHQHLPRSKDLIFETRTSGRRFLQYKPRVRHKAGMLNNPPWDTIFILTNSCPVFIHSYCMLIWIALKWSGSLDHNKKTTFWFKKNFLISSSIVLKIASSIRFHCNILPSRINIF